MRETVSTIKHMVEGKEEKRIRKNDKYIYIMYIICIYIRTHNVKIIKNEREKEEKEETINHVRTFFSYREE